MRRDAVDRKIVADSIKATSATLKRVCKEIEERQGKGEPLSTYLLDSASRFTSALNRLVKVGIELQLFEDKPKARQAGSLNPNRA